MSEGLSTPDDGARPALRFTTVTGSGGVPINVVESGSPAAPAVLFVHGMTQSYLSWTRQLRDRHLARQLRLVAMDLRGHGASGKPWAKEAYDSADPWAADLLAVIHTLGLVKPVLIGWSFGGYVLMDLVSVLGTRQLAGLVLVGTHAGLLPMSIRRTAPVGGDLEALIAAANAFMSRMTSRALPPEILQQSLASFWMLPDYVRAAMAARVLDNRHLVDEVDVPVTFIAGSADPYVDIRALEQLSNRLPQSQCIVIDGTGHMPFAEDPAQFNAALAGVVQPLSRATPPAVLQ